MAYKTSLNKNYYNSEGFIVADSDGDYFYLKTHKDTVKIDIKFTNHFKPFYAMTIRKAQGMTINSDCDL